MPSSGLALINGTQLIGALGTEAQLRAENVSFVADVITAMTLEALKGTWRAFDERVHSARPHVGQNICAARMRVLLLGEEHGEKGVPVFLCVGLLAHVVWVCGLMGVREGIAVHSWGLGNGAVAADLTHDVKVSEIMDSHKNCGKVQDPYSLRCSPQVHGVTLDTLNFTRSLLETELNSATVCFLRCHHCNLSFMCAWYPPFLTRDDASCLYLCVFVCLFAYLCLPACPSIHVCVCVFVHIYTCVYLYTYIYMCVCVCSLP